MRESIAISVIIPVYNVKDYIKPVGGINLVHT